MLKEVFRGLWEAEIEDIVVVVGGIIPESDRSALKELGVNAIFGPGTSTAEIVEAIRNAVAERRKELGGG
jgi:methylmalonyl-CoA mutase C-terminal domain/subunit